MKDVFKRLNWALLLSHKIYGGPPPNSCRKAWCSLLAIGHKLRDSISDVVEDKLDASLQAMSDPNGNNHVVIINTLQDLVNVVTSQQDNQIPKADADAMVTAVQEIIQPLRSPIIK
jgi:hypothetical protein